MLSGNQPTSGWPACNYILQYIFHQLSLSHALLTSEPALQVHTQLDTDTGLSLSYEGLSHIRVETYTYAMSAKYTCNMQDLVSLRHT